MYSSEVNAPTSLMLTLAAAVPVFLDDATAAGVGEEKMAAPALPLRSRPAACCALTDELNAVATCPNWLSAGSIA